MKSKKNANSGVEILIAEDSPTQAEQLRALLEEHGYAVAAAADGKQALQSARKRKPALLIADVLMPELDGYGLCKAIKSDEKLKDIPVILVTSLSDSQDVIRGLECGADNFIRKPYEERYLLSRIEQLLTNLELRKNQKMQMGVEIELGGRKHFITAERQQILDLLISTYEQAVEINSELTLREKELALSNQVLQAMYRIAEGLNRAVSERAVSEMALDRAMELPGIQAGWISLRDGETGFRLAAARNLPPVLSGPDAFGDSCACRRRLLSGELVSAANILECERLGKAKGDTQGLRLHASVPLWLGGGHNTLGVMNLAGPGDKLFDEGELKVLYSVGNQVAVALERARLHEHLEKLVEERTAKLAAEVEERRRIQEEQARLVAILEATPDLVGTATPDGRLLYTNQAGLRMLGLEKGGDFSELRIRELHPEWAARLVLEEGIPRAIEHGTWSGETALLRQDGREIPVSQVIIAHCGARGSVEYLSTIARDITSSKGAEEALRASEARLRTIIEAEPECVKIEDAEGRLVQMNAAGLTMIEADSFEQVQGHKIDELVVPAQREAYRAFVDEVLHGRRGTFEFEIAGLRGGHLWLDTHAVPLPEQQDGRPQMLAITRDITQRKEHEARIVRLNRIYSVLSGINTAIVRVRDRQQLFEDACRIAVEAGEFKFAWLCVVDSQEMRLSPVASAGAEGGFLETVRGRMSLRDDAPEGHGIAARAVREKRALVVNDVANDPGIRYKKEHAERGIRSVAILPLLVAGEAVGALGLHSGEIGFFDEQEMRLLKELTGDISFALDHIEKEERLNYLAYYDVLTELPNRSLFRDRAKQLLRAARKEGGGRKVAVVLLDLERFRGVNETFGRRAGDAVLKQVAERLAAGRLGPDHLARLGADAFAAVLGDLEKEEEAAHFVEKRVIGLLREPIVVDGQELRMSARAGIALFPADGADVDTLVRNAEAALKKAKLAGDKYLFYTPELNARTAERLTLENKLRRALERGELALHYQPTVDLGKGNISGLEALMRWNDPDLGAVPPARFIPVMEETGLILEAGRWALEQAVADFRRWQANGLHPPRIVVNVSQVQLRQKDFVATVERALSGAAGAAGVLALELTESLIMQDVEANIHKLKAVRDMGVEVAIDDFGTGFSSLSYIAKLPINVLKIDRAFIMNMAGRPDDLSIVSTIISLAHSLRLRVVAEGVETGDQAKLLRLLKCDEFQGYLFSPAVPPERIGQFLRENKSLPV